MSRPLLTEKKVVQLPRAWCDNLDNDSVDHNYHRTGSLTLKCPAGPGTLLRISKKKIQLDFMILFFLNVIDCHSKKSKLCWSAVVSGNSRCTQNLFSLKMCFFSIPLICNKHLTTGSMWSNMWQSKASFFSLFRPSCTHDFLFWSKDLLNLPFPTKF